MSRFEEALRHKAALHAMRRPIRSMSGAKEFFKALHRAGLAYHPDDDPATIVVAGGKRLFTDEQAEDLRNRMAEVRKFDWSKWGGVADCPCGYTLHLIAQEK